MPAISVSIQPEIISWALGQAREEQLGTKLMNNIKQWLDGTKTPTFNQIEDFSRKANIPLGYFFLQTPPVEQLQLIEYRTVDSAELAHPSRNLIDTIHEMESVQAWMKEYRQETGFDVLPVVGSLRGNDDFKLIAETIRKNLDLSDIWYESCTNMNAAFNYVRSRLEECGIVVMLNGVVGKNTHRTLSVDEFRAFAVVDEWAPLIFINGADSQGARLFSLFHEIAHIWLGENDLYNDRGNSLEVKPIEILCNAVAGELMVPFDKFLVEWNVAAYADSREKIKNLAKHFRCGESVIARKAFDAKKISYDLYKSIIDDAIEAYRRMKENKESNGGNYYNTMGNRLDGCFVRALCESINSGRTTYSEAYRLTNTSRKTFSEIALRLGGVV
ncbi:ImmA/IrrE family metallo-endopeptidase [Eubacterium sp. MSJ-33]|uniref:ImmA/IrrE family metallo-endopeptidase n=1 Tax=Eubacterium sp. MSJ-33 TaxID=2841528 RepID=UPI001C78A29D|nr:ImmA/IrrE family metallo-endopeptidase [Eubacterium sp. MSJ-33]QWT52206.1 ImmA/IrrE family metallo-endopeptidase [Eubacterium sp. MSJ-33]